MPSFNNYPHLFSPVKIRNLELKNRLVFSPVVSGHAGVVDGQVTEALVQFLGAQARSGEGMVTIGASPVDQGRAQGRQHILGQHGRVQRGCRAVAVARSSEDVIFEGDADQHRPVQGLASAG